MADGDSEYFEDHDDVGRRAYDAFDAGQLRAAAQYFAELVRLVPDNAAYHYMRCLTHKYLREWSISLECNLRSLMLRNGEDDNASHWNAGIAATGLGNWVEARRYSERRESRPSCQRSSPSPRRRTPMPRASRPRRLPCTLPENGV